MGPYCKFCNTRCFVPFPHDAPQQVIDYFYAMYGSLPILATCPRGQDFELLKTGFNLDSIRALSEEAGCRVKPLPLP